MYEYYNSLIFLGISVWLTSFVVLGLQRVKGYLTLKIRETCKVDEILSEWNQYIAGLKNRVMRMKDRLHSKTAYHSAEAHRVVVTYNRVDTFDSRFDEIESMILGMGPAIMTLVQKEFGKRLLQLERPAPGSVHSFTGMAGFGIRSRGPSWFCPAGW